MAPIEHNCSDWDWRLNNIYFSLPLSLPLLIFTLFHVSYKIKFYWA